MAADVLRELVPSVERLQERHLSAAHECLPHQYVPRSAARDFDQPLGGMAWEPAQTELGGTVSTNSTVLLSLTEHIETIRPMLERAAITPDASLTADLGLDSMDLVEFAARVVADYPDFDMNAWLFEASAPGTDCLGSLVAVLASQSESRPERKRV